jgi:hypothetical protein
MWAHQLVVSPIVFFNTARGKCLPLMSAIIKLTGDYDKTSASKFEKE